MRSILRQQARRTSSSSPTTPLLLSSLSPSSSSSLPRRANSRTLHTTSATSQTDPNDFSHPGLFKTGPSLSSTSSTRQPPPPLQSRTGPPPPLKPLSPKPAPATNSSPRPTTPSSTIEPNAGPSSLSSIIHTPNQLLAFARDLSADEEVFSPSLNYIYDMQRFYNQTFPPPLPPSPKPSLEIRAVQAEILLRFLAAINQATWFSGTDRVQCADILCDLYHNLRDLGPLDFDAMGVSVEHDLIPLALRVRYKRRIWALVKILYPWKKEELNWKELDVISRAEAVSEEDMSRWTELIISDDWKNGFGTRLQEVMEKTFASRSSLKEVSETSVEVTEAMDDWTYQANRYLSRKFLEPEYAFPHLTNPVLLLPSPAASSPATLSTALKLLARFSTITSTSPIYHWRQHAEVIVRLLLVFINQLPTQSHPLPISLSPSTSPSFDTLTPLLLALPNFPPAFIPSTAPSLIFPLLPTARTLTESLLLVESLLHAQRPDPRLLPTLWTSFLGSIALQDGVPNPERILESRLFDLVEETFLEEGSAMDEVVQVYLWRCKKAVEAVKEGGEAKGLEEKKKEEVMALWRLEGLVLERLREEERFTKKVREEEEGEEEEEEEEEEESLTRGLLREVKRVLEENL